MYYIKMVEFQKFMMDKVMGNFSIKETALAKDQKSLNHLLEMTDNFGAVN